MQKNKNYQLEETSCPLCNSFNNIIYIERAKELYHGMDEYFNVCMCRVCKHFFTNPRPTKETIKYFYPDEAGYYIPTELNINKLLSNEKYKKYLNFFYNYKLDTKAGFLKALLYYILRNRKNMEAHLPHFVENGKLLDIGCSYGNYLKKMQVLGWKVFGVETNVRAAKIAKNDLNNAEIQNVFFEETMFNKNFFDVVNMKMVLEHTYKPKEVLRKIYTILKKNGQLIISVPDILGFEARMYKNSAYTLQVPTHLHHFTPETIQRILIENDFKVERIIHHNFDRDLVASAKLAGFSKIYSIFSNRLIRKTLVSIFVFILSRLGKTSRMTIYARKL